MTDHAPDTVLARPYGGPAGSVTPPIYQTSLFTFDDMAAFEARMAGEIDRPLYSRVTNPTTAAFEEMMARLEGGAASVGFASGMAAISATLFALVRPGDRIACVEHVYPDAYRLMERMLRPWGVEITYHPVTAFATDPEVMRGAALAYLESPTSMMMQAADLRAIAEAARAEGVTTVIDNSWATPIFQRPLALGIDVVLHSASKYISGHSDTVAGVVTGPAEIVGRIRDLTLPLLGGKLAPFEAWLLVRGLRTLGARMREHQRTADLFVDRLGGRAEVTAIHSPGANTVPGLEGRSGLMSIELSDSVDIRRFADALDLFRLGVSWGGFESLIVPAAVTLAQAGEHNSVRRFGVPERLVRLSLGLEAAEDLWRDFDRALTIATR
ncbi:cystathionine beta-lyase/cystathionine gamma-synthase [Palleronia aestuarii]|uniref:Cystathionine beta-lyase/cystathionine gamma-synthase n=1 Tax=Palleronia aestuarii TaxID=568105 RepID=A0A2W7N1S3_9RHOB|nr:PLP-dependent transferase [Palleronia aestuarii]PZX14355.1 cystathionine beta-lyase/cystathionine gamma-synthase [Palleronia aestuarii]